MTFPSILRYYKVYGHFKSQDTISNQSGQPHVIMNPSIFIWRFLFPSPGSIQKVKICPQRPWRAAVNTSAHSLATCSPLEDCLWPLEWPCCRCLEVSPTLTASDRSQSTDFLFGAAHLCGALHAPKLLKGSSQGYAIPDTNSCLISPLHHPLTSLQTLSLSTLLMNYLHKIPVSGSISGECNLSQLHVVP